MRWEIFGTLILAISASIASADELPSDTNSIQTLTVEQAEELVSSASGRQSLNLNGLTMLSPGVAAVLAKHSGSLFLNGVVKMSVDAERALAKHQGVLQCRGLTTLHSAALAEKVWKQSNFGAGKKIPLKSVSPEAAAVFASMGKASALSFDDLTALSPDVAEALAIHEWKLSLNGLTSLTPEAAEALAKHKGRELSLDGLTALSDTAAEALAKHSKGGLCLNGLTTLSDELAETLAKHEGNLHLNGLTTLSDQQAEEFGKLGVGLFLNGLTTLSDKAAESLTNRTGRVWSTKELSLNGLTRLSDTAAEALAKHDGELSLDGLITLSDKAAEALAKHSKAGLCLNGLTALSDELAETLANHDGKLSLNGLTALSARATEALAKHKRGELSLNGLTTLSPEVAALLAKHSGSLFLNGVVEMSVDAEQALEKHRGVLQCRGLTRLTSAALVETVWAFNMFNPGEKILLRSISPEAAAVFAGKEFGALRFDNLTALSPEVAEAFAKHKGVLSLNGLTTLSPEAAEELAKHEGTLSLNGLTTLSSQAAEKFVKRKHFGPISFDGLRSQESLSVDAAALAACLTGDDRFFLRSRHLDDLTPEAAQVLVLAHTRRDSYSKELILDHLTGLSPEAAAVLATHEGKLSLNGLTTLSPEAAETLAKHGDEDIVLSLNGLTTLSLEAAGKFLSHRGCLSLDGQQWQETTSPQAALIATILSLKDGEICWHKREERGYSTTYGGGSLFSKTKDFKELTPQAARAWVLVCSLQYKKEEAEGRQALCFDGLTMLSPEVARELAKHEGDLSLNGLTALSNELAETLATHKGTLSLNGLTTLSPEAAEALAEHGGGDVMLSLNGLTTLSPELAEALARQEGYLSLNGLTELSLEATEKLATHKGTLYLNGLTTLSSEAAEVLATHEVGLSLNGLTAISLQAAEKLAMHKGGLSVNGLQRQEAKSPEQAVIAAILSGDDDFSDDDDLFSQTKDFTELTPQAAKALILACRMRHREHYELNCDGLTSLTPEVAEVFAQYRGRLSFDGIMELTPEVAEILAKHEGELSLDGLTTISLQAAEKLAMHKGGLSVDSLQRQEAKSPEAAVVVELITPRYRLSSHTKAFTALSPEVARIVVRRGDLYLCFDGLTTLSPETAEALAQHTGTLQLNGLTDIPIEAEIALSKHRNRSGSSGLECGGLTSLKTAELAEQLWPLNSYYSSNKLQYVSPDAIRSLTRQPWFTGSNSVSLDHLTELPPELAASLAECKGQLSLRGLASLSAEAARELMRLRHIPEQYSYRSLSLNGLTTISPEVATELAQNPDFLSLDGLTEISPELARALAKHKGYLCLNGLTSLSDEAAKELARHEGGMSLGVTALSDAAAKSLAINTGSLRLRRIANASPKALALLKARGLRLWMPLQMYSPLERFTWGLTGWLQVALLASLTVMIGCIAGSFYLLRRLSKATERTLATKRQVREAALPLVIGSGLFAGWCLFLSMKLLPVWRFVFAESGTSWPSESFTPLDRLLAVIFLLIISACCYCAYIVHRMRKRGLTQFIMTRFLPSSLSPGKRMVLVFIVVVWIAYAGAIVSFGVSLTLNTFLRQFWPSGGSTELFVFWLAYEGFGVVPIMFGALMLYPLWVRWSRHGRSFDAYSDHFMVDASCMRPEPENRRAGFIGYSIIPWSAVESYSWKPDHLELTVRPGRPHNRISEKWLVSGVVPPEQRLAAEVFLSARMPGLELNSQT